MKKFINKVDDILVESLSGFATAHADLVALNLNPNFLTRKNKAHNKVAIISGGGSGHEPLHAGYIGVGMLDAACPGHVFTSPTPDQMLAAAQSVEAGAGVLFIVKNYSGDMMNFEMAAELAEGTEVASVIVDDDVALRDSLWTTGRRGVGTTVLMEKIVGAAAEEGRDLPALVALATRVNATGRSMGMALTSCTVPAVGRPTFEIGDDEMELGVGIHGEPGRLRTKVAPARDIAELLCGPIIDDLDFSGDVIALVNGMGATPLIELYLMYHEVDRYLQGHGVHIVRRLVGNHITSLDMAGCSVTLLKADSDLVSLWDAPVRTAGLRWGC